MEIDTWDENRRRADQDLTRFGGLGNLGRTRVERIIGDFGLETVWGHEITASHWVINIYD